MINVRHLRAFLALVEHRHFTKAAESVYLSQSALSALIQQLENENGVKLFDRTTRSVEPTAVGLEFYQVVKKFLGDFDDALLSLSDYAKLKKGRVIIGALPSLAATVLPGLIAEFRQAHPDVLVNIIDAPGEEIADLLRTKRVDLAFSRSVKNREIECVPILHDRLVLVGHLKTVKPAGRSIEWRTLADEPIIAMASGTTIRSLVDSASAEAGIHLNIVLTPRLIPTAIACARAGLGCTIVPSSGQAGPQVSDLPQYDLVNPRIQREISLMYLNTVSLPPAAEALAQFLHTSLPARGVLSSAG